MSDRFTQYIGIQISKHYKSVIYKRVNFPPTRHMTECIGSEARCALACIY